VATIPDEVIEAFGVSTDPARYTRLPGGQGGSLKIDTLVFKAGADLTEVRWLANVCEQVAPSGFRLPAPAPALDGRLVVSGWSALPFVEGLPIAEDDRSADAWLPVLAASRALHEALAALPEPPFIGKRTHRWAAADRGSWHHEDPRVLSHRANDRSASVLARLARLLRAEELPSQVIHGDLSGNVLLTEGLPPAVIDVSPYWRPAAYADAVIVMDALLWWRTEASLLDHARPGELTESSWRSLLARALAFRVRSFDESSRDSSSEVDAELERFDEVAGLLDPAN
jgi:uncharacterized protein (TIGR02569 family)